MVKGPPLKEKKNTIKEEYQDKVEKLKLTINNAINAFEKDSGCQVTDINCDYSFNVLSFKIDTNIHIDRN